jgi:four helix bundle protein
MSELFRKYTDVSNGLVDIFETLNSENIKNDIGIQLIASSMSINKHIRQMEIEQNHSEFAKKQEDALREVSSVELLIAMMINGGLITEEKSQSVFHDCEALRELIKSV